MTTAIEQKLTAMIEPLLSDMGYDLIQLGFVGEGKARSLQILAEDRTTHTLDLRACTELSRTIGTHLEVEDIIKGAYRLEISSPGIDRPLVKPADYLRFIGFEVKAETIVPINDQKRYHGKIIAATNDDVTIETDTKTVTLSFADIARARLKLTDELIRASRPAQPQETDLEESDALDEGDTEK